MDYIKIWTDNKSLSQTQIIYHASIIHCCPNNQQIDAAAIDFYECYLHKIYFDEFDAFAILLFNERVKPFYSENERWKFDR